MTAVVNRNSLALKCTEWDMEKSADSGGRPEIED